MRNRSAAFHPAGPYGKAPKVRGRYARAWHLSSSRDVTADRIDVKVMPVVVGTLAEKASIRSASSSVTLVDMSVISRYETALLTAASGRWSRSITARFTVRPLISTTGRVELTVREVAAGTVILSVIAYRPYSGGGFKSCVETTIFRRRTTQKRAKVFSVSTDTSVPEAWQRVLQ